MIARYRARNFPGMLQRGVNIVRRAVDGSTHVGAGYNEVERLAAWLEIQPGTVVADLGAGDGTFAVALARRVGPRLHWQHLHRADLELLTNFMYARHP